MSFEQIMGLLRHVLGFAGTYLVAQGLADDSTVQAAVGGVANIAALVWSIISKRNKPAVAA